MAKGFFVLMLVPLLLISGCVQDSGVTDFDSCAAAGNPVMESYPRQCRAPNGSLFVENIQVIGGNRDEHGCLGPAGYSWNSTVGACLREWELNEAQREGVRFAVAMLSYRVTAVGVDFLGCEGCFDIHLQRNDNQQNFDITVMDWKFTSMTFAQAKQIAESGSCVQQGGLKSTYFYNENSKTWWFDLDIQREGCAPACVVSGNGSAEINWRCTGLIVP